MGEAKRRSGRPANQDTTLPSDTELMKAALTVFAEKGYEGASMRLLARQLGVSHNFLNFRFGSKMALWSSAVDYARQQLEDKVLRIKETLDGTGELSTEQLMREMMLALLLGLVEIPQFLQMMNNEGARNSDRLDYICRDFHSQHSDLQMLLRAGHEEGVFKSIELPVLVFLLMHGAGGLLCLEPLGKHMGAKRGGAPEDIRRQAEIAVDVILSGLLVK